MSAGGGGDGGALVSVADVPPLDLDERSLYAAAENLAIAGGALRTRTEAAGDVWQGLPAVYEASGTEPLYGQVAPAAGHADRVATALTRAGDALLDLAIAVSGLRGDHDTLLAVIPTARQAYLDAEPDSADALLAGEELRRLRDDVDDLAARIEIAETTCTEALESIRGGEATGLAAVVGVQPAGGYPGRLATALTASTDPHAQLQALAAMTPEQAQAWLTANPDLAALLVAAPPPPDDVAAWWATVMASPQAPALSETLLTGLATGLGNLAGMPYWARSEANQVVLADEIAAAEQALEDAPEGWTSWFGYHPSEEEQEAQLLLDQLRGIETAMNRDGVHQLVELHPGEPPLAAVATGDLDTATHVGVVVPGINTTTASLPGLVGQAEILQGAQQQLDPGASPAVVAWVGYEPATTGTVWESGPAEAGAEQLGVTLDALDTTNSGAYTTVYAHSYGSTTAALALQDDDHGVDALAMYGSAGLTVDHVSDLALPADDVWAGEGYDDDIADLGRILGSEHPHDPTDDDFGAQVYTVPPSGTWPWNAHDQGEYFQGESLGNLAAIGMDRPDVVTRGDHVPEPVELVGP